MLGKGFKSGSYKGLDIAFGQHGAAAGILLRSIMTPEHEIINGPSLLVDHILELNSAASIPEFVSDFDLCVETPSKLYIKFDRDGDVAVYRSARVGLSMKKTDGDRIGFVAKPYRYLTFPERIPKGRDYLIAQLFAERMPAAQIAERLGCKPTVIARVLENYENGKGTNPAKFSGKALTANDVCAMLGALLSK